MTWRAVSVRLYLLHLDVQGHLEVLERLDGRVHVRLLRLLSLLKQ